MESVARFQKAQDIHILVSVKLRHPFPLTHCESTNEKAIMMDSGAAHSSDAHKPEISQGAVEPHDQPLPSL